CKQRNVVICIFVAYYNISECHDYFFQAEDGIGGRNVTGVQTCALPILIDIAISPQQATISALLSHVRKADIVGVSSLRRGVAEAIEAVAHGDESTSRVVGRVIDEIKLTPGTIIGAVVRGNDVMIANDNLRIEQGDHVIMFLTDKKFITDVERLFQPSPFFL